MPTWDRWRQAREAAPCGPGTVPRGAVRLEAEAAMGLDSVVTLALGLGTGGTAERRLRPGCTQLGGLPTAETQMELPAPSCGHLG